MVKPSPSNCRCYQPPPAGLSRYALAACFAACPTWSGMLPM